MRAIAGPRWLGVLIPVVLVGGGFLLAVLLAGFDAALLRSLWASFPLVTAATVAAPLLSGLLGISGGLLAARLTEWMDRRVRTLVIAGGGACLVVLALVGAFWFAVQGELRTLQAMGATGGAGLSTLGTLLLPATAAVFGVAAVIALRVRAATRLVSFEGHVQTASSWGLPTTGLVLRRVLRRTLPVILTVLVVEFLILYAGSFTVQAVVTTPSLAASLPLLPLLPAQGLPVVLVVAVLCIIGVLVAPLPLASTVPGLPPAPSGTATVPAGQAATRQGPRAVPDPPTLPSTTFRSSDFLDIRDLRLHSGLAREPDEPLPGISLTVPRGQALAVVGGAGDGGSLLCHAIAGLLPVRSGISSGSILFDGTELVGLAERQFRRLRGHRIGFLAAPGINRLDPDVRVGHQLARLMAARPGGSHSRAGAGAAVLLADVGIEDAAVVSAAYPHQLSVATAQRVLLAGALLREPWLLIADNPTGTLAADDEAGFLDVLHSLQRERGFTLIVASARVENLVRCDRVAVMSEGTIVEHASPQDLLTAPRHPHSRLVLDAGRSGPAQQQHRPDR